MTRRLRLFALSAVLGAGLFLVSGIGLSGGASDPKTVCLTPMVQHLEHYPQPECDP
jgi:hypothetical protein